MHKISTLHQHAMPTCETSFAADFTDLSSRHAGSRSMIPPRFGALAVCKGNLEGVLVQAAFVAKKHSTRCADESTGARAGCKTCVWICCKLADSARVELISRSQTCLCNCMPGARDKGSANTQNNLNVPTSGTSVGINQCIHERSSKPDTLPHQLGHSNCTAQLAGECSAAGEELPAL